MMPWPSGPFLIPLSRVNVGPRFSGRTKRINKADSVSGERWLLGTEETILPNPGLQPARGDKILSLLHASVSL